MDSFWTKLAFSKLVSRSFFLYEYKSILACDFLVEENGPCPANSNCMIQIDGSATCSCYPGFESSNSTGEIGINGVTCDRKRILSLTKTNVI